MNERLSIFSEKFLGFAILAFIASFYLFTQSKEQVFYILFPISFILTFLTKRPNKLHFTSLIMMGIANIVLVSISTLWSSTPGEYLTKTLRHGVYLSIAFTCFYWWLSGINADKRLGYIFKAIIFSSLMVTLITLGVDYELIGNVRLTHRSLIGLTSNPIHSGFFVGVSALLSLHFFRRTEDKTLAIATFLITILFMWFILLTKSRGAVIFLLLSFLLHYLLIRSESFKKDLIAVVFCMFSILLIYLFLWSAVVNRLNEPYYRIELISSSIDIIKSNFWFGTGLSYEDSIIINNGIIFSKVHNSFIQMFQITGVFGFILLMLFTLGTIVTGLKSSKDTVKLVTIWLIYGSLYLAVDGDILITRPSYVWFNYWIPVFIILAHQVHNRNIESNNVHQ